MAKEDAAAADGEGVVEQAPTRMFSTAGLAVLIGSNVAVVLIVFLVVSAMMGGGEEPGMPEGQGSRDVNSAYLNMADLTTKVPTRGGKDSTVRYSLLIGFAGGAAEQTAAITHWEQGNRDELLRGTAARELRQFTLEDVSDASFTDRFESRLMTAMNKVTYTPEDTYKIDFIQVTKLSWD